MIMNLQNHFQKLAADEKRMAHIILCEFALDKWNEYVSANGEIRYIETVCGTERIIEKSLPADAIGSVKMKREDPRIEERLREPITAIRDGDLELPETMKFALHSFYNLYRKYMRGDDIDDWLIVNQALSADENFDFIKEFLARTIKSVKNISER